MAAGLGAIHAWADRYHMNADGISYLDMGDAYLRGDWSTAINGYWSPLYSWLLGLAMSILKPDSYWEFPVAHLVNFLIYLGALGCFHFLMHEIVVYNRKKAVATRVVELSAMAWYALGYSLFIWSSLTMITLSQVAPDLCVAAFVFLASGILLRISGGSAGWMTFAALGLVLGLGYLAKAPMFPLAFVFMGVAVVSVGDLRRAIPRGLVALAVFLIVGGPFMLALSVSKGRMTFGDSAKLNYMRYVNEASNRHWQGTWPPGIGTPKHPTRKIDGTPAIYEFGTPITATYPPWYDPSYWNEGVAPRIEWRRQAVVLGANLAEFLDMFLRSQSGLIAGFLILFLIERKNWLAIREVGLQWSLLVPALAGFAMYMPVYFEPRYIGAFVVLFWLGIAFAVRLPESQESTRLVSSVTAAMVTVMLIIVGVATAPKASGTSYEVLRGVDPSAHVDWQVSEGLRQMGLQPGEKVGVIGEASPAFYAHWARLARARIVAEIVSKDANEFFWAEPAVRSRTTETFARAGARVIIANSLSSRLIAEGWQRIGETNRFAYWLPASTR